MFCAQCDGLAGCWLYNAILFSCYVESGGQLHCFLVDPLNVLTIQRPSWSAHHAATQCIGLLSCCHAMEGAIASVLVSVAGRQAWILDCILLLALCAIHPALKTNSQDMPIRAAVDSISQHWQGGNGCNTDRALT